MGESMMGPILGKSRIKYEVLDRILPKYEAVTDTMDVFLDVRTVFGVYFNDRFKDAAARTPPGDRMMLSAELMNIVAHYRRYLWDRRGITTRFVMVHSDFASTRCAKLVPGYKSEYEKSRSPEGPYPENAVLVERNLEIAAMLAQRIPGTAFVDSAEVDPDCVPLLLARPKPCVSLCLSNNPSWAQYACFPRMNLLTLKGDESRCVRYDGVIDYLSEGAQTRGAQIRGAAPVPYRLAEWILAIGGSKKHGVPGWKGFGPSKAFTYLSKRGLSDRGFYDGTTMVEDMEAAGISEERRLEALLYWDALSVRRNAEVVSVRDRALIDSQLASDPDPDALQEANMTHFGALPLRLGFLLEGAYEGD
jgi:hypothetical protein